MPANQIAPLEFVAPSADGNAFPTVVDSSTRQGVHALLKDVSGRWHFRGLIPANYSSTPVLKVAYIANATSGVTRLNVEYAVVSPSGGDADPTLTALTAQNDTVPGTAYAVRVLSFTGATGLAAGSFLEGAVHHDGANASDTLAVDTLILAVWLDYTSS